MKSLSKISKIVLFSIIVFLAVVLGYLYFQSQRYVWSAPKILETQLPYEEPQGWQLFENDFFTFQYPPGLKIRVQIDWFNAQNGFNMFDAKYHSKINNVYFSLMDQTEDWKTEQQKQMFMFFHDPYGAPWEIHFPTSEFPADSVKIADTLRFKPKPNRYRDAMSFSPGLEVYQDIFHHCGSLESENFRRTMSPFFQMMVSDMDLKVEDGRYKIIEFADQKKFSGVVEAICIARFTSNLLQRAILIVTSDMDSRVGIFEYDFPSRTALATLSKSQFTVTPRRFTELKNNTIRMIGERCYELGQPKIPCFESLAAYDFEKKEIKKLYDRHYDPILGQ